MPSGDSSSAADRLFDRLCRWTEARPEVRAAILAGSRARDDGSVDDFSDIDVELFLDQPEPFAASSDWLSEIGTVWVCLPLHTLEGYPTRLAIYEGGAKIDFTLCPLVLLEKRAGAKSLPALYRRGFRVLIDKDGLTAGLSRLPASPPVITPPSEAEFRALVEEFWFEAYHVAKYLARDDLWAAKMRDWGVKELLRAMIEWDEKSRKGWSHDTHHLGVRMRHWADADTWQALHGTFGGFAAEDSWPALRGTTALFSSLARRTAKRLGFGYPEDVERNIGGYIEHTAG